ncbi:MAG TPA: 16S rRNA (adenine(1518)-N(6)/adenine(1519)-N(6))-dimethyltransferase RsmA [Candidatus Paceibacterota bacterium]|jgi:16S rRNA (adenine1518-N6/adenine1519-N6)-dimethyltransferase
MPAPKKSLGQNFLMHPEIAGRIVRAADVPSGTTVLEIGPGTGMLTRALLADGYSVIGVEADGELVQDLQKTFAQEVRDGRLALFHADIRTFEDLPSSYALVANIPYYITGEIIRMFLTTPRKPQSMTLLVQKEVAERIARSGKGRSLKESLLSLSVKAYGEPKYCFTVPRGAFRPAPSVDSAVISIRDIKTAAFESSESERFFFEMLRKGFAHKRKLLSGNLAALAGAGKINSVFEEAGIPPKARAEDLELGDWKRLSEVFGLKKT